jgi:type 1 glutamine amidotransferase
MMFGFRLLVACLFLGPLLQHARAAESVDARFAVLVFSKTTGYRHDSIPVGITTIRGLGTEYGFAVDDTEDAGRFNDTALAHYKAVVFLNTTGDILDPGQKEAFERYIRSGGGFVGIHSASDTEYQWPWYGRLVGAWFASHPTIQRATVRIEDPGHPSTKLLPLKWQRTDEWYNFRANPRNAVHVLATLDESSYTGGMMGSDHPIAWCQAIGGGRAWYTAMGHTSESYTEPLFRLHLAGGIESVTNPTAGCQAPEKER